MSWRLVAESGGTAPAADWLATFSAALPSMICGKSALISPPLPRAVKWLLCALSLLFVLSPAHAFQQTVAPTFYFGDPLGNVYTHEDTVGQEWADIQAYFNSLSSANAIYTVSNLHPEPTLSYGYAWNGVWVRYYYDYTLYFPSNGNTYFHANYSYIQSYYACPQGFGATDHVDSSTSHTLYCQKSVIDPQPPPKCDSCVGNHIYAATGQKVQVETDYAGLPGLAFDRTYRTTLGFFASATTTSFIDYSRPSGTLTPSCFSGIYNKPGVPPSGGLKSYCFPYMSISQPNYHLLTVDGRYLQFSGPNSAVTQNADINERVTQVINSSGATEWHIKREDDSTEVYTADGTLTQTVLRNGQVITYTYSDASTPTGIAPRPGLLLTKTDAFGHALSWRYDSIGRMVQMQDPAGGVYQYSYDAIGNLTGVTYPDGSSKSYLYNESAYTSGTNLPQAMTGIADENGVRFATFKYDSYGRGISTEHAGGVEKYTLSYSSNTTVVDPLGTTRLYYFQSRLSYMTDYYHTQPAVSGSGTVWKGYTYDANGNIASVTDFVGNVSCYAYDLTRNLETVRVEGFAPGQSCPSNLASYTPATGTTQRKITTTWSPSFRLPTLITEAKRTTAFTYDSFGNQLTRTVTDTTTSASRTWTYTYDSYGRVLSEDGPRTDVSDVTTYTYYTCATGSECGQIQTITNAASQVTTYNSYNAHGQPTQMTDPNGVVTTLAYDLRQRLTDRCVNGALPTCTGGELTHTDYWPTGLLKKVTLPDGSFVQYGYDSAHRLTQVTDNLGNSVVYTLDAMGNRTAENVYDPSSNLRRTHSRVYNALNRLYQDVNAASTGGATTTYGYDNNANQTAANAPLGRNTTNLYDALDRLKQITNPASGNTYLAYDANDNLSSVTDPKGLVTSYTYNGFGELVTQISPDTGTSVKTYDSGGNLATSTDARSAVATYSYDALNRPTSVAYTKSGVTDQAISFTYDAGTYGKGHLTGASDADHSMSWVYDAQGRISSKDQTVGAVTLSVGYGYTNGLPTTLTLPSGNVVTYGYNASGQVTSVALGGTTILGSISYEPFGPVKGWTWGNGMTQVRSYDQDGRITAMGSSDVNGVNLTFGYDGASRITSLSDSGSSPNSWTYGYDALDRLASATGPSLTQGWTYDANGNRLSETGTQASSFTVSATSNRLNSTAGFLNRTYTYDAAGNALTYEDVALSYNNRNRLASTQKGSSTRSYMYNALGQLAKASGGAGGTVLYAYDETGHLIGEYDGSGALIQETVWLDDIPVATLRPGSPVQVLYVHADHLGTPQRITRPSDNARLWQWNKDPFGTLAADENPDSLGALVYDLRFPGQLFDGQAGLHQNYFRDYSPAVGRYVESDPVGLTGGINTYAYVNGDPIGLVDPLGLLVWRNLQTYAYDFSPGTQYSPIPGAPPIGSPPTAGGTTLVDWQIQSKCSCSGKGAKFDEFVVDFRTNVHIRPGLPANARAWARRGEGDHVADYVAWANSKGKQIAQMRETRYKGHEFSSQAECETATSESLDSALRQGGIMDVLIDTIDKWDLSGKHTYGGPNQRP